MVENFKSYNYNELYFKIGKEVPVDDVNIAYFENSSITSDDLEIISTHQGISRDKTISTYAPDSNNVLYNYPEIEQNYIYEDNIILTNLTLSDNNRDDLPLFYLYKTRYCHDKETNDIEQEIDILDKNLNIINKSQAPYILNLIEQQNGYQIELKLTEAFISSGYYIDYNPKYTLDGKEVKLPEHYIESINYETMFNSVPRSEIPKYNNEKQIYSINEFRGAQSSDNTTFSYQVRIPHRAATDEQIEENEDMKEEHFNIEFVEDAEAIFDYRIIKEGYTERSQNGLICYFVYDHTYSMKQSLEDTDFDDYENGFDLMNETIKDFMKDIDENVDYDTYYNVLYYNHLASYSNVYGHLPGTIERDFEPDNILDKQNNQEEQKPKNLKEDISFDAQQEVGERFTEEAKYYTRRKEYGDKVDFKTLPLPTETDYTDPHYFVTPPDIEQYEISDSDVFFWEIRDGAPHYREDVIESGLKTNGLWGGETAEYLENEKTNLASAYKHALEKMIYHRNKDEYKDKKAVIIMMTDGSDNTSHEDNYDFIMDQRAIEKAMENDIQSYVVGWNNPAFDDDKPKETELKSMANNNDYYLYHGQNIIDYYEDIKQYLLSPTVYAPIVPGDNGKLTKSFDSIPWNTTWISNDERIVLENIPHPQHNLVKTNIKLHYKTEDGCLSEVGFLVNDINRHIDSIERDDYDFYTVELPEHINERNSIKLIASGTCRRDVNSRKYFVKTEGSDQNFQVKLHEEAEGTGWFLNIANGHYTKTKTVDSSFSDSGVSSIRYLYTLHETGYRFGKEKITREDVEPEQVSSYMISVDESIDKLETKINDSNIIIPKDDQDTFNVEHNYDDVKIIDWNTRLGNLLFNKQINNYDLSVSYKTKIGTDNFIYDGFYTVDDEGNDVFCPLNLNPQKQNISGNMTPDGIKYTNGNEMAGETVYIYMKPYQIQKLVSNEFVNVPGTKRANNVFHTIGEPLGTVNYPYFDRAAEYNIDIDDIVLLARIHIPLKTDDKHITTIDTRTRGGGVFPGNLEKLKENLGYENIKWYWDIGHWNGKPYPANAVIVIEIPKEILKKNGGYLSEEKVMEKIEKHLALGVLPIIREV